MSDKQTIGHRLEEIIADKRIKSRRSFALSIGADPSFFDKMVKGLTSLTEAYAEKIVEKYGVNREWLYSGEGPKYATIEAKEPTTLTILDRLSLAFLAQAEAFKAQAEMMRNIENNMARQDTQEEINKRTVGIEANLENLWSGHQLIAIRQASDRETLFHSLERLEKKDEGSLLKEADRKKTDIERISVQLGKHHDKDKSHSEKLK